MMNTGRKQAVQNAPQEKQAVTASAPRSSISKVSVAKVVARLNSSAKTPQNNVGAKNQMSRNQVIARPMKTMDPQPEFEREEDEEDFPASIEKVKSNKVLGKPRA